MGKLIGKRGPTDREGASGKGRKNGGGTQNGCCSKRDEVHPGGKGGNSKA